MVLSIYKMDRERICQTLLQKVAILSNWSVKKVIEISEYFQMKTYQPGDVIYEIGDSSEHIYFIQSGLVQLQLHYLISETNSFPVSKQEVMRTTSNLIVKRVVREIGTGS